MLIICVYFFNNSAFSVCLLISKKCLNYFSISGCFLIILSIFVLLSEKSQIFPTQRIIVIIIVVIIITSNSGIYRV
jgi:hypothetical protein